MPSLKNITLGAAVREGAVTYPVDDPHSPATDHLHHRFPTRAAAARSCRRMCCRRTNLPDDEYPMVLSTGRCSNTGHTGSMTRRSMVLDQIEPERGGVMSPRTCGA